jgi:hypothetical protein
MAPTDALGLLLTSVPTRLARDNARNTDPMRLRLSASIGPVASGHAGMVGATMADISRLLDCKPVREILATHPELQCAAVLSDALYEQTVQPGRGSLHSEAFRRINVELKNRRVTAWLWTDGVAETTPGAHEHSTTSPGSPDRQDPRAVFTTALQDLHSAAGRPAYRLLSKAILDDRSLYETVSHETIGAMLRGDSLPRCPK